ncbi:hypothetical protein M434DRAFT_7575 [Hypoxylon sp. CO27-5]|nr:hypothetical protein M434DRAFT_7575 [Hypoxylon sp. CO27-5]
MCFPTTFKYRLSDWDINHESIKAAAEESRKYAKHAEYRVLAVKVDVTDAESVQSLVTSTMSDTNIAGAVRFVRAVMAAMAQQEPLTFPRTSRHSSRSLGRGSIVLLGSISSLIGTPGMISYTTAKHAIIGITKSAAVDALALQSAIRVNAVCPAWVDTPMVRDGAEKNPLIRHAIGNITPLKRAAAVDEVADYIVFLCSPSASFINGTALPIDAGFTLPAPPALLH